MITRIYIDGYRNLVNFELKLGEVNLFLGSSGAGKSSVFKALLAVRDAVVGDKRWSQVISKADFTYWDARKRLTIELEIEVGGARYAYGVELAPVLFVMMRAERLHCDGEPVYTFAPGASSTAGSGGMFAGRSSRLSMQSDLGRLGEEFVAGLSQLVIVAPVPPMISEVAVSELNSLDWNCTNFVSWLRYLTQEHHDRTVALHLYLKEALPGFVSFRLEKTGSEEKRLQIKFKGAQGDTELTFGALSDGQRQLFVLYTILACAGPDASIWIDEPDNYLELAEIQPWLLALEQASGEHQQQYVLVSHNPEVINHLGASNGIWFAQTEHGPARLADRPSIPADAVSLAELVARRWLLGSGTTAGKE